MNQRMIGEQLSAALDKSLPRPVSSRLLSEVKATLPLHRTLQDIVVSYVGDSKAELYKFELPSYYSQNDNLTLHQVAQLHHEGKAVTADQLCHFVQQGYIETLAFCLDRGSQPICEVTREEEEGYYGTNICMRSKETIQRTTLLTLALKFKQRGIARMLLHEYPALTNSTINEAPTITKNTVYRESQFSQRVIGRPAYYPTPLILAINFPDLEMCRLLVAAGADVDLICDSYPNYRDHLMYPDTSPLVHALYKTYRGSNGTYYGYATSPIGRAIVTLLAQHTKRWDKLDLADQIKIESILDEEDEQALANLKRKITSMLTEFRKVNSTKWFPAHTERVDALITAADKAPNIPTLQNIILGQIALFHGEYYPLPDRVLAWKYSAQLKNKSRNPKDPNDFYNVLCSIKRLFHAPRPSRKEASQNGMTRRAHA